MMTLAFLLGGMPVNCEIGIIALILVLLFGRENCRNWLLLWETA